MQARFELNGRPITVDVTPNELASDLIRDRIGLTGTHVACDTSQCGACVVHVDGASVKSCTLLAASLDGTAVTTIEGIGRAGQLHPMQQAFTECHGLQCGFCTPGMIMSAIDYAHHHPHPTVDGVKRWLEGNLCRCTGYQNIVAAVMRGSAAMHSSTAQKEAR